MRFIRTRMLLLATATTTSVAATGSMAAFTDSAAVTGNAFTAGTVDLVTSLASTALTASNMAPGAITYGGVKVTNSGTLGSTYGLTVASTSTGGTPELRATLLVVGRTIADGVTCDATSFAAATALAQVANEGALEGYAFTGRTLGAGAAETLCFRVTLPTAAPNGVQGQTTTATFTFTAST